MHTYSPDKVNAQLGPVRMAGFGPDTMIEIEFEADAYSKTVGADGEVARTKSSNQSGEIRVTLLQTSPTNALLSALFKRDQQNSTGVETFGLIDAFGRTVFTASKAWIKKQPVISYANEVEVREWTIDFAKGDLFVGGALDI
jgi:hypothetical protein